MAAPVLLTAGTTAIPGERTKPTPVAGGARWLANGAAADAQPEQQQSGDQQGAGGGKQWVVNKEPIAMTSHLYAYLLAHTPEPQVLAELREETSRLAGGWMQIAPEQGQLLAMLVQLMGATRCADVGVFTGYSTLSVALALPPGGRLFGFDRDPEVMAVATRYFERAGVAGVVDVRIGPALEGVKALLEQEGPGTLDFIFFDADKRNALEYFDTLLALVRPGGLIAFDNALFYGAVADDATADPGARGMRAFEDALMSDKRVSTVLLPVGDGTLLIRKK